MDPGQVYKIRISLPPISNLFKAGHPIKIDVASSNVDRFDMNPNTGEPMGRHTHMIMAHNTVYLNSGHPSYAVLPTIPSNSWGYRRDVATRHETE